MAEELSFTETKEGVGENQGEPRAQGSKIEPLSTKGPRLSTPE